MLYFRSTYEGGNENGSKMRDKEGKHMQLLGMVNGCYSVPYEMGNWSLLNQIMSESYGYSLKEDAEGGINLGRKTIILFYAY